MSEKTEAEAGAKATSEALVKVELEAREAADTALAAAGTAEDEVMETLLLKAGETYQVKSLANVTSVKASTGLLN
jgi:hypothetical protein